MEDAEWSGVEGAEAPKQPAQPLSLGNTSPHFLPKRAEAFLPWSLPGAAPGWPGSGAATAHVSRRPCDSARKQSRHLAALRCVHLQWCTPSCLGTQSDAAMGIVTQLDLSTCMRAQARTM